MTPVRSNAYHSELDLADHDWLEGIRNEAVPLQLTRLAKFIGSLLDDRSIDVCTFNERTPVH